LAFFKKLDTDTDSDPDPNDNTTAKAEFRMLKYVSPAIAKYLTLRHSTFLVRHSIFSF
jgi:hypothetical protein